MTKVVFEEGSDFTRLKREVFPTKVFISLGFNGLKYNFVYFKTLDILCGWLATCGTIKTATTPGRHRLIKISSSVEIYTYICPIYTYFPNTLPDVSILPPAGS